MTFSPSFTEAIKRFILKDIDDISVSTISRQLLPELQTGIGAKIIKIRRIKKSYGSNSNSFFIDSVPKNDYPRKAYFLKFGREKNIDSELSGDKFIAGALNSPKVILYSKQKLNGYEWVLYEYISGRLMSKVFSSINDLSELNSFLKVETKKEIYLSNLHSKNMTTIGFNAYINLRANKLFYKRLIGSRYKDFYESNSRRNISLLFDRIIILNGQRLPFTINEIITSIRNKYEASRSKIVAAISGHGDAHHGNIIVNDDIWFIDNEYADITTPFMELAKPYYNDLLGDLFFYDNREMDKCFSVIDYKETSDVIHITIINNGYIRKYIDVTKIKIELRKSLVNDKTNDFLSLNDYLVLCHLLTKNPNNYKKVNQKRFIAFAVILSMFDPLVPESMERFFRTDQV